MPYKGMIWTLANNRLGEGFIEERLDLVFGSIERTAENEKAGVQYFLKYSSDQSKVLLDTYPDQPKNKTRFIFDNR